MTPSAVSSRAMPVRTRGAIGLLVVIALGCNAGPKRRAHADDDAPPPSASAATTVASAVPTSVLSVSLPRAHAGSAFEKERFAVRIDKTGKLSVDGRELADDAELHKLAREAKTRSPSVTALIFADRETVYRRVIEVMDALKTEGIADFAFAVEVDASPPPAPSR